MAEDPPVYKLAPTKADTPYSINPKARLKIIALEPAGTKDKVTAQFNPSQVQLDATAPWSKQVKKGVAHLEYTGKEPRSMSFELFFDGFESGQSIQPELDMLKKMLDHIGTKADEKRPPKVMVIWGEQDKGADLPDFPAVLESVSIKYTMMSPEGKMLRATASVKLKEASFEIKVGKGDK